MAPKHHPTPLSGGDRKALNKELGKARAMTHPRCAVGGDAGQGRDHASAGRPAALRKLERTDVERWRTGNATSNWIRKIKSAEHQATYSSLAILDHMV